VSDDLEKYSQINVPLPIGHGQTISQPQTVAFMFELLEPKEGQHILDVGSGSGWTTALLGVAVGSKGTVTALELVSQLCKIGEINVKKINLTKKGNIQFHCQSGENGFEKNAPYDRILVSASALDVPIALKQQLAVGGIMVMPIGNELWKLEKKAENDFDIKKFPGFVFVPFIKK
jgi:protein-L-isoaspartate(D-aspartate) O-methyltransferase